MFKLKALVKQLNYEPVRSYSYYDDGDYGKVLINIKGIGKLKKSDIKVEIKQRSFSVKIDDFEGKALIFAVPKTHNKFVSEESKFFLKENKIVLKMKKLNVKEEFSNLYKVKMIGEEPSDDEKEN